MLFAMHREPEKLYTMYPHPDIYHLFIILILHERGMMPYNPFLGFCRRVPPLIKFPQAVSSLMISGEGRSHNYETHEIIHIQRLNSGKFPGSIGHQALYVLREMVLSFEID